MANVKWIKIATDIFNNKKIRVIESMPEGDSIIVIWFKILMAAGIVNDEGNVYFTKEIPYTDQMLATVFNRPLTTIQLALRTFEEFGMIEIVNDVIHVSNWAKYQNVEGMERVREQTRLRVSRHRELKKMECNVTCNATVTQSNATDIEEERDIEKEKEKNFKDTCSEPSQKPMASKPDGTDSENAFIDIPTNTGEPYYVSVEEVAEYKSLYPAVDVEQELRNMKGWSLGNASKRKTRKGMKRFINSWLAREQDRGGSRSSAPSSNTDRFAQFAQNRGGDHK